MKELFYTIILFGVGIGIFSTLFMEFVIFGIIYLIKSIKDGKE